MIEQMIRAGPEPWIAVMNDKQILITGATNGIGLAAAEALAALGASLAIVGRSKTRDWRLRRANKQSPRSSSRLPKPVNAIPIFCAKKL
jgi:NAD(P)-dependent dehydrogenase (short-subunit alcohol dehydrogenase family)